MLIHNCSAQNQALRSVLQLLAYGGEDDSDEDGGGGGELWMESDGDDDDDQEDQEVRAGRLMFYSTGSSYDEDETAASVGAQVVSSLQRGRPRRHPRRPRQLKPSPELVQALNKSDYRYS